MGSTLLKLVLRLEGDSRKRLEAIRATPLQAGVLLFLCRHADAKLMETAAALGAKLPTLSQVVTDLVGKRWVTKCYSVEDRRALYLRLRRRGETMARRIKQRTAT